MSETHDLNLLEIAANQRIKERTYWLANLAGQWQKSHFPYDPAYSNTPLRSMEKTSSFNLEPALASLLIKVSGSADIKINMCLTAALVVLLHKYTYEGRDDIVVGAPIFKHAAEKRLPNTVLIFRNTVSPHMTFKELLLQLKQTYIEATRNQNYPVEILAAQLNRPLSPAEDFTLFDTSLLLRNIQDEKSLYHTRHNMMFSFLRTGTGIEAEIHYNSSLYKSTTIQQITDHFLTLLSDVLANLNLKLSETELLSAAEKNRLLNEFNRTGSAYDRDKLIHQLFEDQAARTPCNIALQGRGGTLPHGKEQQWDVNLSYRQLNEKANQLARLLRSKNIGPHSIAAIMLEPCVEIMIAILAVLKSGAAYLPIDPRYPADRVRYILNDSNSAVLLTQKSEKGWHDPGFAGRVIYMDNPGNYSAEKVNLENINGLKDLGYIIYTSGSTGRPKGVMVEHRNLLAYVHAFFREFEITADDTVIQQASLAFDAFVEEVYPVLLRGGKLAIPSIAEIIDAQVLAAYITSNRVNLISCSPLLLNELNKQQGLDSVHTFINGGDVLKGAYFDKLLNTGQVYNTYGPTETTVCVTYYKCPADSPSNIPIGKPIANYTVRILDESYHEVPVGVTGELCVLGHGVSRGYLNNPGLTAEKFVAGQSLLLEDRFYRTGDLARWLPDGNIQLFGRCDQQVKIRGYRIELGEIENRILEYDGIHDAVVVTREEEQGEKNLCAYFVYRHDHAADQSPSLVQRLRDFLSLKFPDYMVPAYFSELQKIPLTPSGKVDRRALPAPVLKGDLQYTPPAGQQQERLVEIWADVLGIKKEIIGIHDNFFTLGGHSFKATVMSAKIHKEINVKIPLGEIFNHPTVMGLSSYIKEISRQKYVSIEPAEEKEYYPLSSAQKRLYILQQMEYQSTAYNLPTAIPLAPEFDIENLETPFRKLFQRHESLRTSFHMLSQEPVQKVHPVTAVAIEIQHIPLPAGNLETDHILHRFTRPFDMSRPPLCRIGLVRIPGKGHFLLVDMHHIISDGVSHGILEKDFTAFYNNQSLPPLGIQYKDFCQWRNSSNQAENMKQSEQYWLREFSGEIPVLNLPTDFPRPAIQSFAGADVHFEISSPDSAALMQMALDRQLTLFMVLLGITNVLLAKISNQQDIIIATPIAGRNHADLENVIGMFVNTLALRHFPSQEKTFLRLLEEIKENTLPAFENQDYPFEELVEKTAVRRDVSRNPLFDVMFVLQNFEQSPQAGEATEPEHVPLDSLERGVAKFDLTLTALESGEKLYIAFNYCTQLFKKETIHRFVRYYQTIISSLVKEPGQTLAHIDIIPAGERETLLYTFNNTHQQYPPDKSILQLFEEQVGHHPLFDAVVGQSLLPEPGSSRLTYKELHVKSSQLAFWLRERGVQPGAIVAIMVERSLEMLIGILAILKTGAAYLPIDLQYPRERIDYILKDSRSILLLTLDDLSNIQGALPHGPFPGSFEPDTSLAYVIYTSGSTGKPKGVLIPHGGVVNLVYYHRELFADAYYLRASQLSSPGFDAMAFEIWPCLCRGAALYIVPSEIRSDALKMKDWLLSNQITASFQSPALAMQLLDLPWPANRTALRIMWTGGDRLTRYVTRSYPFRLYNLYGPTEDTIWTTWLQVPVNTHNEIMPPIGKPVANHYVYIVSSSIHLQPIGITGELCIAGAGSARGYLNRPALTAEKFIENPFSNQQPLYRTGDLARWQDDGNIEFIGRIDHQVKVRGFRIELGEIENQLLSGKLVKEAVVIAREDNSGDSYLCAYIVPAPAGETLPRQAQLSVVELKEYLGHSLPEYMIPSYFFIIADIPLTPNGKTDRKALPEPTFTKSESYTPPSNLTEKKLLDIWADVLGIETDILSVDENFFALGGHSLKATVVISRVNKLFNVNIPLAELFRAPTIKTLGKYIASQLSQHPLTAKIDDGNLLLLKPGSPGAPNLFFIHDGTGEVEAYIQLCNGLHSDFNYWGLRANRLKDAAPVNCTIQHMARSYIETIKKLQPQGPYYIVGWSMGGTIAYEMAAQIEENQDPVALLSLVDAPPPHIRPPEQDAELEFNLQSELDYIKDYAMDKGIIESLLQVTDICQFWSTLVQGLESGNYDVEPIRQAIRHYGLQALSNLDRLGIREAVYYLNVGRTFQHARQMYNPQGKINTSIHYFAASESTDIHQQQWNQFTRTQIKSYQVIGDHISILAAPAVNELAKGLDGILKIPWIGLQKNDYEP